MGKVPVFKFNNWSDEKSSSKYSVCEEEHLGNWLNEYSNIRENGVENLYNLTKNRFQWYEEKEKSSSTETFNDSVSFEEVNYNSASNHMKDFQKYSTKKKHQIMKEGSSGGLFTYKLNEPSEKNVEFIDESDYSDSQNFDNISIDVTSTESNIDKLIRNASISSLPANKRSSDNKVLRCTSLINLMQKQAPSAKERYLLNQYLHTIKEESDDNFKRYKEKNDWRKLNQQEDVEFDDSEISKNTPMNLPTLSRYDSSTSIESSAVINIPNQTRSVKQDSLCNSFIWNPQRKLGSLSRNVVANRANPMFRTFEGSLSDNI